LSFSPYLADFVGIHDPVGKDSALYCLGVSRRSLPACADNLIAEPGPDD